MFCAKNVSKKKRENSARKLNDLRKKNKKKIGSNIENIRKLEPQPKLGHEKINKRLICVYFLPFTNSF